MLAIDTSRSMAATDVKPSRLAAALAAARTFLDVAPEEYSVGIVSFSTRATVVLSPTTDRDAARTALDQIRLGSGTALGDAIDRSVAAARPGVTAGQADARRTRRPRPCCCSPTANRPPAASSRSPRPTQARKLGVPVNTVALGTRDAVVEVPLPGGLKEQVTVDARSEDAARGGADHGRPVRGGADRRAAEAGLPRPRQPDRQEAREARGDGGVRRRRRRASCSSPRVSRWPGRGGRCEAPARASCSPSSRCGAAGRALGGSGQGRGRVQGAPRLPSRRRARGSSCRPEASTTSLRARSPGYVVAGTDARVATGDVDVSFRGEIGSPVGPGVTTHRSVVFHAARVPRRAPGRRASGRSSAASRRTAAAGAR